MKYEKISNAVDKLCDSCSEKYQVELKQILHYAVTITLLDAEHWKKFKAKNPDIDLESLQMLTDSEYQKTEKENLTLQYLTHMLNIILQLEKNIQSKKPINTYASLLKKINSMGDQCSECKKLVSKAIEELQAENSNVTDKHSK